MILLLGKTSQIGSILEKLLKENFKLLLPSSLECNFLKSNVIKKYILKNKPKLIINCSAYTNVELAEHEKKKCKIINVDAVRSIAEAAKSVGAWVIHYSTDYVFNGKKRTPYKECDRVFPLNYYGKTKLWSEGQLKSVDCNYSIIRTSWILSKKYNSFSSKIISRLSNFKKISVVVDQFGTPNSAKFIAKKTYQIACKILKNPKKKYKGLFHLSSTGITNWFNLAIIILKKRGVDISNYKIQKIYTRSLNSSVKRPLYSKLNSNLIKKTFNIKLVHFKKLIKEFY
jgi:dTDP-4-dehydrorhamnose reductase